MDTSEMVKQKYERRILALLRTIAKAARAKGYKVTAPYELTDEKYCWAILITPKGKTARESGVDCSFTIVEEKVREGEGDGFAFHLSMVAFGGEIVGDFAPFNYSPELWCHTADELAERFQYFAEIRPDSAIERLREYEAVSHAS